MAYSTSKPSSLTGNLSRPSFSAVKNGYGSALSGLSGSLSDLRKQLVDEQIAQLDYEIEVGTASPEEKISLYEEYLGSLVEGTTEWYRVSTKIQNLQDSASTEDFAIAKSLYAGNQISSEQYYRILKERVAEGGLSQKEQRQRTTELWSFEQKMQNETTDTALRDSLAQEELGLITAGDRLSILQQAYSKETDPDRQESMKFQILTQQKKVYKENVSLRELTIRKGIQEGVNTKEDLLPIYAEKIQTAFTAEDALQAEIGYQSLVKDIQNEYVQRFEKGSKEVKSIVNSELGRLDRSIEQAKNRGDITGLSLLYENKRGLIEDYFNSDMVTQDDKLKSSNMLNFLKNVYGMDVDLETGNVINVAPTDLLNVQNIEDSLQNPDSSLLVRSSSPGGDTTVKLVRGEKISVTQPDGSVKSFYDFGENIAVSRIDPSLTRQVVDPITGEVITDSKGNPVLAPSLPSGREVQKLPEGYQQALESGNLKPLPGTEFKGEYVELYKDGQGNPVRGYVVYGDKFKDVLGAQPLDGRQDTYLLTTENGDLPSQKYVSDNKLFNPSPTQKALLGAGVFAQKLIPDFVENPVRNVLGIDPSKVAQDVQKSITNPGNVINLGLKANDISNKIKNLQLPTAESISKSIGSATANLTSQLSSALFKTNDTTILKPLAQNVYKTALQTSVNNSLKNTPFFGVLKSGENILSGAKNLIGKGLSFLGFNK